MSYVWYDARGAEEATDYWDRGPDGDPELTLRLGDGNSLVVMQADLAQLQAQIQAAVDRAAVDGFDDDILDEKTIEVA